MSNFDFVAAFYDGLSGLVFQNSIEKAGKRLVDWVAPGSKVLLLGGGTGQLLKHFKSAKTEIEYVELSSKMMNLAKKQSCISKINFHTKDYLLFEAEQRYDFVICPFFLDLFPPKELEQIITKVKKDLKSEGKLLIVDFSPKGTGLFNLLLLKIMILFFRLFSGIRIKKYNQLFDKVSSSGFVLEESFAKRNNFILINKYSLISQA